MLTNHRSDKYAIFRYNVAVVVKFDKSIDGEKNSNEKKSITRTLFI